MSVITSRLRTPAEQNTNTAASAKIFCNANTVMQRAIEILGPGVKNAFLLRCDELPFVQGDADSLQTVFMDLIQLIADKKDTSTKLYLHISSTIDNTESGLLLADGFSRCSIHFHTNITPCTEWRKMTHQNMSNLTALLATLGGSLTVNSLKNSGCILSASLPGKL